MRYCDAIEPERDDMHHLIAYSISAIVSGVFLKYWADRMPEASSSPTAVVPPPAHTPRHEEIAGATYCISLMSYAHRFKGDPFYIRDKDGDLTIYDSKAKAVESAQLWEKLGQQSADYVYRERENEYYDARAEFGVEYAEENYPLGKRMTCLVTVHRLRD